MHSEHSTAECNLRKRPSWQQGEPAAKIGIKESWEGSEGGVATLLVYAGSEKEILFNFSMSSVVKSFKLLKVKWRLYNINYISQTDDVLNIKDTRDIQSIRERIKNTSTQWRHAKLSIRKAVDKEKSQ